MLAGPFEKKAMVKYQSHSFAFKHQVAADRQRALRLLPRCDGSRTASPESCAGGYNTDRCPATGGTDGRWLAAAALLLAMGVALPAWAGDAEDCGKAATLVQTDPARVVATCRRLAKQGNAVAQNNLGALYETGQGVAQDYAEAVKWFRKAADQGNAVAQNNLAILFDDGNGVARDYAEAARWYRKAGDQGLAAAQFELGVAYAKGQGVPQDYVQAHLWFNLAAAQGDDDAAKNRDVVARKMMQQQVQQAKALAAAWKPKTGQ
jgi:TPR repeat protein